MYTLTNIHTNIIQDINISKDDFDNGNYIGAGEGVINRYLTDDLVGVPKKFTTKVVKHKSVEFLSWDEVREWREEELKDSDWRVVIDYPNSDQQAWIDYRNKLRDLPQDYSEMVDVVVPDKP